MNRLSHSLNGALLTAILAAQSAQAGVVKDINNAMTDLLSHPPLVTNVYDVEKRNLLQGSPKNQPWSGSYWPDILGGISNHYRARSFVGNLLSFGLRYDVAKSRMFNDHDDVKEKFNEWDEEKLNWKLSPSEKYDLLVGDTNFTLTKAVMEDIDFRSQYRRTTVMMDGTEVVSTELYDGDNNTEQYADVQGTYASLDQKIGYAYWKKKGDSIAYWFGICDGWSPASIYLPRPTNSVRVQGKLGHWITFYPDDLKALGSYLFARTNGFYSNVQNYKFAGRPCASGGDPERLGDDSEKPGLVKDFRCNDVDAGVWYLSLVNRIGLDKLGFIFEVDNNKKINNHPISDYEITYFNPKTGENGTLQESLVHRSEISDSYRSRRNPNTVYLVGVKTKIKYLYYQWVEKHHASLLWTDNWETDSPDKDETDTKTYTFDIELDANGNVLGGEWGNRSDEWGDFDDGRVIAQYSDQPDFIWMAAPNYLPQSEMSAFTEMGSPINYASLRPFGNTKWAWNGKGPELPQDWLNAAKADAVWSAPVPGEAREIPGSSAREIVPPEAKGSIMKSAQPLSNIVYYLFDKARLPNEK